MAQGSSALETRFAKETGVAREIAQLVEPVIEDLGIRLVRVALSGRSGCTVQIMVDRASESVSIDDCAAISRQVSPLLDANDPIAGEYHLEVSTAGIDRPLVRPSDFEDWAGHEAKVELKELIDGRRRFRGEIEGFADGEIRLKVALDKDTDPQVIGLPVDLVAEAKLVMSDALLKAKAPRHA